MAEVADQPFAARILVVEDEARLVRLIRAVLETQGYRVTVSPTGERALAQVALEMPDLVLLDLRLPAGWTASRSVAESASSRWCQSLC